MENNRKITELDELLIAHLLNLEGIFKEDIIPIMIALKDEESVERFAKWLVYENLHPTFEEIWMEIAEINPSIKVENQNEGGKYEK